MAMVTPGDILARCQTLDARVAAATKAIDQAPESQINGPFRTSWHERRRRWEIERTKCGDLGSRMWNFKWAPILDDWEHNQATWEAKIQARTGVIIPIGPPLSRPSDETVTSAISQAARFPEVGASMKALAIAAGVTVAGAIVLVAMRQR